MPPQPGEESLITVFADIHYYFATPTVHPLLHRFDKASYLYIYHNATRHTSRIEVANHPGTPNQDAFNGHLDTCHVINSHRFPTLMTLIVDGASSPTSPHPARLGRDADEWKLPSADPRDPGKQSYRIHTIDVYFWAEEDGRSVIHTLQQLLDPSQLDVAEIQPDPGPGVEKAREAVRQDDIVHPVVQNLENVAISGPAYQNGRTGDAQRVQHSPYVQQQQQQQQPTSNVIPGARQAQNTNSSVSPVSAVSSPGANQGQHEAARASFAPVPYNPAAPAAPEPISHREDTPPPPDDGSGTGLAAAAVHDRAYTQPSSQAWTGVPPTTSTSQYGAYNAVPGQALPASLPPPPADQSRHTPSIAAQHYVPAQTSPSSEPAETPGAQFYSSIGSGPHKALGHVQPQYADYLSARTTQASPPPGGYSQYSYGQASHGGGQAVTGAGYEVHSQVYRPTEAEASHGHQHKRSGKSDAVPGRKESRVDKVEKSGRSLFKKIDKKFGIT